MNWLFITSYTVACTRMYWNSSTGESAPDATALKPSKRGCFLVMRRSLFLMAATILSSEAWWVLIEYKWQPGTKRRTICVRLLNSGAEMERQSTLDMCFAVGVVPWHHPTDQCVRHRPLALYQQQVKCYVFAQRALRKVTIPCFRLIKCSLFSQILSFKAPFPLKSQVVYQLYCFLFIIQTYSINLSAETDKKQV